jgi:hypothetical protein
MHYHYRYSDAVSLTQRLAAEVGAGLPTEEQHNADHDRSRQDHEGTPVS